MTLPQVNTAEHTEGVGQSGLGMRERRLISRSTASLMNSPRLFGPASSSMRSATSADSRMVVTTVSALRLSGGRPMRRLVTESPAVVNFAPVSYSVIDPYNVFAYNYQQRDAVEAKMRLVVGEKLWNGATVSPSLAATYNALSDEIEAFERSGRQAPANLLNGRHNLIANVRKG